ncbi:unnamed protein product [Mytilus edulis]|uniref:EF-hand domain-containing protein n=1 Tax=Mytilus edulis TaxID=6550 RepID=A0A8S3TB68_MYTED|nr:unnamed protein product [Mytilus edulis]
MNIIVENFHRYTYRLLLLTRRDESCMDSVAFFGPCLPLGRLRCMEAKKVEAALRGQTCIADIICGGSWLNDRCTWFCDNICKVFANDTLNWPGELVTLPCKFSEYDYTRSGYFYPADLAYHVGERGQESDNLMVFKYLDQNGDGKVSSQEFSQTSKYLLTDQELCKSTKEI